MRKAGVEEGWNSNAPPAAMRQERQFDELDDDRAFDPTYYRFLVLSKVQLQWFLIRRRKYAQENTQPEEPKPPEEPDPDVYEPWKLPRREIETQTNYDENSLSRE